MTITTKTTHIFDCDRCGKHEVDPPIGERAAWGRIELWIGAVRQSNPPPETLCPDCVADLIRWARPISR